MRTASLSVPEVVREIITKNRSIYDCMKMDIVNYTALAVKIQPDVERYLGKPYNEAELLKHIQELHIEHV